MLIGVDVSKNFSTACFYNRAQGVILKNYRCQHSLTGFQQFLEKIGSLKSKHAPDSVILGVEPTGNYHKILVEFLKAKGYLVVYVSSVAAKNNRKTLAVGRWGKNDPKDALNIVKSILLLPFTSLRDCVITTLFGFVIPEIFYRESIFRQ